MLTQRKLGWRLSIRRTKGPYPYIAYAIHSNGKVEREGCYREFSHAITAGGDLVRVLNLHHLYGGKYQGTDVLRGREIDPQKIESKSKVISAAIKKLVAANKRIFGI